MGTGKSVNLSGRIDRIDKVTAHEYVVIDYKTGSARDFKKNVCFNKGKTIQHALYSIAAEKLLRKLLKDEKLSVTSAGYLFPTERETGRCLIYGRNDSQLTQLLDLLCDIISRGIFLPSYENDSCTYCEYTAICGESAKERAKLKFENQNKSESSLLRMLKNYE